MSIAHERCVIDCIYLYVHIYVCILTSMSESLLHVKIRADLALGLKGLAASRGVSVSELVRQALIGTYQLDIAEASLERRRALNAYAGGYISLGKLAEEFGLDIFGMRDWLRERGIEQYTSVSLADAANAE